MKIVGQVQKDNHLSLPSLRTTTGTPSVKKFRVSGDIDGVQNDIVELVRQTEAPGTPYSELRGPYPIFPSAPFENIWISNPERLGLLEKTIPDVIKSWTESLIIDYYPVTAAAEGKPEATPNIHGFLNRFGISSANLLHLRSTRDKTDPKHGMHVFIEDDYRITGLTKMPVILYPQPYVLQHLQETCGFSGGRKVHIYPNPESLRRLNGHSSGKPSGLVILARDWLHIHDIVFALAELYRE